ncbi:sensor histidine kinase [Flavobacterium suncheonense]|uniref:histidine kinase n=1 Tax=Flavobacterium suncheonense GH29-5 = DSM 17707 TaxID=1121899 RepID=A0A0A2MEK0_9FLAO|nr:HAMP domain-containing sensor histidine kinase [Flavobacterium suncheonense]KGO90674.1 histidine kinase [Flavobacterium suncheonense GH29-5 = DSM 17707]
MAKRGITENLKLPKVYFLFFVVFFSCASLILVNYGTIRILSANRAYVNGESHYSKGQKDAVRHLTTYLYTKDEEQWISFLEEISVPKGDGLARMALIKNQSDDLVKQGLRAGRNKEEDLDDIIWLYKNFNKVSFFTKAMKEWEAGDSSIDELIQIGNEIHQKLAVSDLDAEEKQAYLLQIGDISETLTENGRNFSNALTEGSGKIKQYLVFANIFFILVIISAVSLYFSVMLKKLLESAKEIELKNKNLVLANRELDSFVYSASHDLRSPITSLKGLIEIAKEEKDPNQVRHYFGLMNQSLTMQDQFINDIIDYSRNKRKERVLEIVNFDKIVNDILLQHNYLSEAKAIQIKKNVEIDEMHTDGLRLKIILNNLVSNAIKYSDKDKNDKFIEIAAHHEDSFFKIEVKDNGIGIKKDIQAKIFEMFFGTDHNLGSGLGLYITKQAVENLKGTITVASEVKQGSTFTVIIPKYHET